MLILSKGGADGVKEAPKSQHGRQGFYHEMQEQSTWEKVNVRCREQTRRTARLGSEGENARRPGKGAGRPGFSPVLQTRNARGFRGLRLVCAALFVVFQ